ncbi:putative alanyl-tRNA synthetase [Apiospora phragmitis]|uniref:Alanyl-tRNA synthetase n=1 Tax=Apiospora phragmitis TaxID=2905665 RepID=A0ABR1TT42_9PEZI
MQRTYLAFQRNAHLHTLQTAVTAVRSYASLEESNKALFKGAVLEGDAEAGERHHVVVTEQTIFHPQGGGQPSDVGSMESGSGSGVRFSVSAVRMSAASEGEVLHFGQFLLPGNENGANNTKPTTTFFQPGETVTQTIDAEKRLLYSRYHTAGHVLGAAVRRLLEHEVAGFDELKASHFPAAAACEFAGLIDGQWKEAIQRRVDECVAADLPVEIGWWDEADFRTRGLERLIPDRRAMGMADDEKFRVVDIVGAEVYPCGGTHVDSTRLCGQTNVRKISRAKGNSRVSYVLP